VADQTFALRVSEAYLNW